MPGGGRASTRTSVWSDDATEVVPTHQNQVKEGRLIDIDDEEPEPEIMAPSDKLRDLLRQMDEEARRAKPLDVDVSAGQGRGWNNDAGPSSSRGSSPALFRRDFRSEDEEEEMEHEGEVEAEREEESPPTPPPRFGNPYAARRVSGERRGSPNLTQPGRLPSRAAVLLHSTSSSPPSERPITHTSPPSQLRSYIASHADLPSDPSSSRSTRMLNRSVSNTSSTSSRKGKEREQSPPPAIAYGEEGVSLGNSTSRRNRFRESLQQRHQYVPQHPDTSLESETPRRRVPPTTPRRISVDIAPDDLASFERHLPAAGLELRAEVELDLDEGLSAVVRWEGTRESSVEEHTSRSDEELEAGGGVGQQYERTARRSASPQFHSARDRSFTPRPIASSPPQSIPRSRETSLRNANSYSRSTPPQSSHTAGRPSHSPSPPLPALPEPEISQSSDSSEVDTYSSRRAALFRSGSKSLSSGGTSTTVGLSKSGLSDTPSFRTDQGTRSRISVPDRRDSRSPNTNRRDDQSPSKYSTPAKEISSSSSLAKRSPGSQRQSSTSPFLPRRAVDIPIPPQEPITVGMATISTPSPAKRRPLSNSNTPDQSGRNGNARLSVPTPKPPGAWQSTPRGKVRFSPLRNEAKYETSFQDEGGEDVSILRLRVSPKKVRSPRGKSLEESVKQEQEADTSWTGRVSRSLARSLNPLPIPTRSATFAQASESLIEASATTLGAQRRLESTQKQWLEALSSLSTHDLSLSGLDAHNLGASVSKVVRKSWGWGSWAWWVILEMIVLWGVFRVTLDYANSIGYTTGMDPFHPLSRPLGLGMSPYLVAEGKRWSTWSSEVRGGGGPIELGLPIPGALKTLVGGGGGSANLFDLVESWELWRRFGAGAAAAADEEGRLRLLSGVPS
ncbi:hypothetical protein CI109_101428 [Kwoniella shandongensis]|uniref:Uncharacterized protein n=1 Tax=Kwoniella shandongensis TaxID=1734106 RepID=A0AAJ8MVK9_9TREE